MRSRVLILLLMLAWFGRQASSARASGCPQSPDPYSQAVLADSPVAYYRLDESAGPTLCDSSTSANNGTYNSTGITYGAASALASGDPAISADGASTTTEVRQSGADPSGEGWTT
jgi:hypothetical protein